MPSPARILLLSAAAGLSGCGDLNVRYVPPPEVVPAQLEGEWTGTWQSTTTGASGAVTLRIQEFDGEPVISVATDNPFVVPGEYQLVVTTASIALSIDGVIAFEASLLADGQQPQPQLDGWFDWGADAGTWSATWLRSLPEPLDLGGRWEGVVVVDGMTPLPLVLELDQVVEGGVLALVGTAAMPGLLEPPLPVHGVVSFDEDGFSLALQTEPGFEPQVVLAGNGDREPLQLSAAALQVLTPGVLPFSQALVQLSPAD